MQVLRYTYVPTMALLEARGRHMIGQTCKEPAVCVDRDAVSGDTEPRAPSISTDVVAGQDTVGNALLCMPIEHKPDSQYSHAYRSDRAPACLALI